MLGWCNFAGTIVFLFIVNLWGRKSTLNLGLFLISLSHIFNILGIHFEIKGFIFVGVGSFLFFFGGSVGSLNFLIGAESLPATLGPVVGSALWITTMLLGYFTLSIISSIGIIPIFIFCMVSCFLMGVLFLGYGVETKNKSLSQVTAEYNAKRFMRAVKLS